ncbi:TPA: hypothetical protein DE059_03370, partial [Candidatus Peribacteria bacterium]|nr:hypothetical protein [Candidatus Peribacteria bacterium]
MYPDISKLFRGLLRITGANRARRVHKAVRAKLGSLCHTIKRKFEEYEFEHPVRGRFKGRPAFIVISQKWIALVTVSAITMQVTLMSTGNMPNGFYGYDLSGEKLEDTEPGFSNDKTKFKFDAKIDPPLAMAISGSGSAVATEDEVDSEDEDDADLNSETSGVSVGVRRVVPKSEEGTAEESQLNKITSTGSDAESVQSEVIPSEIEEAAELESEPEVGESEIVEAESGTGSSLVEEEMEEIDEDDFFDMTDEKEEKELEEKKETVESSDSEIKDGSGALIDSGTGETVVEVQTGTGAEVDTASGALNIILDASTETGSLSLPEEEPDTSILISSGSLNIVIDGRTDTGSLVIGTGALVGSGTTVTATGALTGSGVLTETGIVLDVISESGSLTGSGVTASGTTVYGIEENEDKPLRELEGLSGLLLEGADVPFSVNTHPTFAVPKHKDITDVREFLDRVQIEVTDSDGKEVEVQGTITEEKTRYLVTIGPNDNFRPGIYHVRVYLESLRGQTRKVKTLFRKTGQGLGESDIMLYEGDIPWGTVAFNTDRPEYIQWQGMKMDVAFLNENQEPVCDGIFRAMVEDPNGERKYYATEHESIEALGRCDLRKITPLPDYSFTSGLTSEGKYKVRIGAENGVTLIHNLDVKEDPDLLDIKRSFVTRTYPGAKEKMKITIIPTHTFVGEVSDKIPKGYEILSTDPPAVTSNSKLTGANTVKWQRRFVAGIPLELTYTVSVPDEEPIFSLVGPLKAQGYAEDLEPEEITLPRFIPESDSGAVVGTGTTIETDSPLTGTGAASGSGSQASSGTGSTSTGTGSGITDDDTSGTGAVLDAAVDTSTGSTALTGTGSNESTDSIEDTGDDNQTEEDSSVSVDAAVDTSTGSSVPEEVQEKPTARSIRQAAESQSENTETQPAIDPESSNSEQEVESDENVEVDAAIEVQEIQEEEDSSTGSGLESFNNDLNVKYRKIARIPPSLNKFVYMPRSFPLRNGKTDYKLRSTFINLDRLTANILQNYDSAPNPFEEIESDQDKLKYKLIDALNPQFSMATALSAARHEKPQMMAWVGYEQSLELRAESLVLEEIQSIEQYTANILPDEIVSTGSDNLCSEIICEENIDEFLPDELVGTGGDHNENNTAITGVKYIILKDVNDIKDLNDSYGQLFQEPNCQLSIVNCQLTQMQWVATPYPIHQRHVAVKSMEITWAVAGISLTSKESKLLALSDLPPMIVVTGLRPSDYARQAGSSGSLIAGSGSTFSAYVNKKRENDNSDNGVDLSKLSPRRRSEFIERGTLPRATEESRVRKPVSTGSVKRVGSTRLSIEPSTGSIINEKRKRREIDAQVEVTSTVDQVRRRDATSVLWFNAVNRQNKLNNQMVENAIDDSRMLRFTEKRRWQLLSLKIVRKAIDKTDAFDAEITLKNEGGDSFDANAAPTFRLLDKTSADMSSGALLDETGNLKEEVALREIASAIVSKADIKQAFLKSLLEGSKKEIAQTVMADSTGMSAVQNIAMKKSGRRSTRKEALEIIVEDALEEDDIQTEVAEEMANNAELDPLLDQIITKEVEEDILDEIVAVAQGSGSSVDKVLENANEQLTDYAKTVVAEAVKTEPGVLETVVSGVIEEEDINEIKDIKNSGTGTSIISITLIDGDGEEIKDADFHFEPGSVLLTLEPHRKFKPGKYHVRMVITHPVTGEQQILEQDFTWGVLAINPDKDVYMPGDRARLDFGVLDDAGEIVCNAILNLDIETPSGELFTLNTQDKSINVTGTCGLKNAGFIGSDYEAFLTLSEEGVYKLRLTAETPAGTRTMTSKVRVDPLPPYVVRREAATRLWPFAPSPMTVEVEFFNDFEGYIVDTVPSSFEITEISEGGSWEIGTESGELLIKWPVSAKKSEKHEFKYMYDAPDISPEFYLVGPLELRADYADLYTDRADKKSARSANRRSAQSVHKRVPQKTSASGSVSTDKPSRRAIIEEKKESVSPIAPADPNSEVDNSNSDSQKAHREVKEIETVDVESHIRSRERSRDIIQKNKDIINPINDLKGSNLSTKNGMNTPAEQMEPTSASMSESLRSTESVNSIGELPYTPVDKNSRPSKRDLMEENTNKKEAKEINETKEIKENDVTEDKSSDSTDSSDSLESSLITSEYTIAGLVDNWSDVDLLMSPVSFAITSGKNMNEYNKKECDQNERGRYIEECNGLYDIHSESIKNSETKAVYTEDRNIKRLINERMNSPFVNDTVDATSQAIPRFVQHEETTDNDALVGFNTEKTIGGLSYTPPNPLSNLLSYVQSGSGAKPSSRSIRDQVKEEKVERIEKIKEQKEVKEEKEIKEQKEIKEEKEINENNVSTVDEAPLSSQVQSGSGAVEKSIESASEGGGGEGSGVRSTEKLTKKKPGTTYIEQRSWQIANDAGSNIKTWDGGGAGDTNWSTASNWNGDTIPAVGDVIYFDGTSDNNAVFDTGFTTTLGGLWLGTDYDGTVTLEQPMGISGSVVISGGTLSVVGFDLKVTESWTQYSSGNFNAGTGTVYLMGTGSTGLTLSGSNAFSNLTIDDGLVGYW